MGHGLKRAAKKWTPVFRDKAREIKESRACCGSIESQQALDATTDGKIEAIRDAHKKRPSGIR